MQVLHTHYSFPFSAANFATLLVECWSLLKCMNCIFVWLSIINFPVWCGHSVWVINCFLIKLTVHGKQVTLRSLGNIQVISSGQSAPSSGTTPLIYKAKDVQKTQSICCIITNISDVIFTLSSFSPSVIADGLSLIAFFNPCCRAMFMLYRQKLCQALRTGALKVREQCIYLQWVNNNFQMTKQLRQLTLLFFLASN